MLRNGLFLTKGKKNIYIAKAVFLQLKKKFFMTVKIEFLILFFYDKL